jgi:hypothetical protein
MDDNRIQLTMDLVNPERNYGVSAGTILKVRERLAEGGVIVMTPFGFDILLPRTHYRKVLHEANIEVQVSNKPRFFRQKSW